MTPTTFLICYTNCMSALKIGIIASNLLRIHENVRKGTEVFVYNFAQELHHFVSENPEIITPVFFASGNSDLPFPIIATARKASSEDTSALPSSHKLLELSLFAKAFEKSQEFDVFHIHVSNGEWLLPFARLTKTPLVITMHGGVNEVYDQNTFSLYNDLKHVHFISISDSQRKRLPSLPYQQTIYHGVDTERRFTFSEAGGEYLMWAGRGIPSKGPDLAINVFEQIKKPMQLFPIIVEEHLPFLSHHVLNRIETLEEIAPLHLEVNFTRKELIPRYQESKAFLFPLRWEEPFGFVMAESLSCGTPVIAFARGSAAEIVKDGETGFLVNPSPSDKRGNYITQDTGLEGLIEAVNRMYTMPHEEYRNMRRACREDATQRFSIKRMVKEYVEVYEQIGKRR